MRTRATLRASWRGLAIAVTVIGLATAEAEAQKRRDRDGGRATAEIVFSVGLEVENAIRAFYADRAAVHVEALPPGIRKNLARGKPLPPGIAKRSAPRELVSRLSLPAGYELVEVGLDVLVVEVATAVVHDILMDVIR